MLLHKHTRVSRKNLQHSLFFRALFNIQNFILLQNIGKTNFVIYCETDFFSGYNQHLYLFYKCVRLYFLGNFQSVNISVCIRNCICLFSLIVIIFLCFLFYLIFFILQSVFTFFRKFTPKICNCNQLFVI